jgi:hypothetical protein
MRLGQQLRELDDHVLTERFADWLLASLAVLLLVALGIAVSIHNWFRVAQGTPALVCIAFLLGSRRKHRER